MKIRAYIRVAKHGYKTKLDASTKSSEEPIFLPKNYSRSEKLALPTVGFAVDFEIPDQLFSRASVLVASIKIGTKDAAILSELPVVSSKK